MVFLMPSDPGVSMPYGRRLETEALLSSESFSSSSCMHKPRVSARIEDGEGEKRDAPQELEDVRQAPDGHDDLARLDGIYRG